MYDNGNRRLRRPYEGRVLGGVCAGLADLFGLSVGAVRIVFILSGVGLGIYLLLMLAIPNED